MRYRELGRTGPLVSEIGMGCEGFAEDGCKNTLPMFNAAGMARWTTLVVRYRSRMTAFSSELIPEMNSLARPLSWAVWAGISL